MKKILLCIWALFSFAVAGSSFATNLVIDGTTKHVDLAPVVIAGKSTSGSNYVPVQATSDGGLVINQNTVVDPISSTTTNLAAGATFTGPAVADLNYTAVQFTIKADQNCYVYVEQSPDGTNWDISDRFEFYTSKGGAGNTIQLVASYYRIRVTNIGSATTTFLRLQTIDVPFLPSLPRSLDQNGNLKTQIDGIADKSGFTTTNTQHGETLVAPVYRLVGSTFAHPSLDPNFWTGSIGTGGTVAPSGGELTLSTGVTANNAVSVTSVKAARHIGGTSNRLHGSFRLPDSGATLNNTRRWGAYTSQDGAFFETSNGIFSIVTRKAGVDTKIADGSFNGDLGAAIVLSSNSTEYDIVYSVDGIWFYVNGEVLHVARFPTGAWATSLDFPVTVENMNTGGSIVNTTIYVRHAIIARLGNPVTQPRSYFQQGLTAGVNLKLGAGNLQGIVLSGITNNAVVTFYDNTTATGAVIWTSGPLTSNGLPFFIDMKNISYSVGLSISVTGAALNVLTMYE